jgi:hypothetical protein
MRRLIPVVLVCLVPSGAARADGGDYAVDNREWNGLSGLVTVAAGRGLSVESRAHISWSELGPSDVLFILYPTTRVDPGHLSTFLRYGGRALIADDFGNADAALANLNLVRVAAPRGAPAYEGNPALPFARPVDEHPLTRAVTELCTNHPTAFRAQRGPDVLFSFAGRDQAVVVAGKLGKGTFVALSDPSILINAMLAFDGNLTFAVNLLDFLAPERPGRIVVITHDASLAGAPLRPGPRPGEDEPDDQALTTNELLEELSAFFDELNEYLAPELVLRVAGMALGTIALIAGLVVLPFRRGRDPDTSFARLAGELSGSERLLRELDDDRREPSYAYPALVLRENAEAELLARRDASAAPARGRREVEHALEQLRRLPQRGMVLGPELHVSRRDFVEAHAAVAAARKVR